MATVRLLTDNELSPQARAVFDDIRTVRQTEFINNFWRALAHDPVTLQRTWESIKQVMRSGALIPSWPTAFGPARTCVGHRPARARARLPSGCSRC